MGLFDLFKKKEKESCPLCGGAMGLIDSELLADGASICSQCAKGLRSEFPVEERNELDEFGDVLHDSRGFVRTYMFDHLSSATLEDVKRAKSELEFSGVRARAELGGDFEHVFTVTGEVFSSQPKALDVGLVRAKQLKNKMVAEGLVQSGSFTKGDMALLLHDGQKKEIKILEVHKKDIGDFYSTISANMSKSAKEGDTAWLILDLESGIAKDDVIAK